MAEITKTLGSRRASEPSRALTREWRRELQAELAPRIRENIIAEAKARASGIGYKDAEALNRQAEIATRKAILGSDDILARVYQAARAPQPGSGKWSLETLKSAEHAQRVADSLQRTAQDQLEKRLFAEGVRKGELTGRRQWVSNPGGRTGALNGTIVEPGEKFNLDGKEIDWPREDPEDVAQWSNSSARILWETEEGEWI